MRMLEVNDLHIYYGAIKAVKGISFYVDKGEIVAVDTPENLEASTRETTSLEVTVDDLNNNFESLKDKIREITDMKLLNENPDNTKKYLITTSSKADIRKVIFSECSKQEITILEMKRNENSLEDAFVKLVEDRPEYSEKELKKMQYEQEIEEIRLEEEEKRIEKETRKQAIKEEKARKKAAKEAKKEAKAASSKEEKKENVEEGGDK